MDSYQEIFYPLPPSDEVVNVALSLTLGPNMRDSCPLSLLLSSS